MSSITNNSRLQYVPVVQHTEVNNQQYSLDWLSASYLNKIQNITEATDYIVPNLFAYRPDLLSFKLYATVDYWWVISFYNGFLNPMHDLYEGRRIKVPSLSAIQNAISQGENEAQAKGRLSPGGENSTQVNDFINIA